MSSYIFKDRYKQASNLKSIPLDDRNELYYVVANELRSTDSIGVLNNSAKTILQFTKKGVFPQEVVQEFGQKYEKKLIEDSLKEFFQLGFIQKEKLEVYTTSSIEQNKVLNSWLHITDRCNLKCAYCFLPHIKKDMTLNMGKSIVNSLIKSALSHGFSKIKLKYAGGEPLIKFEIIREIQKFAVQ